MNKIELKTLLEDIKKNGVTVSNSIVLSDTISRLNDEIMAENNKSAGKTDVAKSANSIIKDAKRAYNKQLHGSWIADGKQYVCDGCRALEILEPIELEKISDDVQPVDVKPFFDSTLNDEVIQLPSKKELENLIKQAKSEMKNNGYSITGKKFAYKFECGAIVNAKYLIDAIVATGCNTCMIRKTNGKYISPLMFRSDNVNAIVLPINAKACNGKLNLCDGKIYAL